MIKCAVCGTRMQPKREATVGTRHGLMEQIIYFDVMDCPSCGCQITLHVRCGYMPENDEDDSIEEAEFPISHRHIDKDLWNYDVIRFSGKGIDESNQQ